MSKISRRTFLKVGAAAAGALAFKGLPGFKAFGAAQPGQTEVFFTTDQIGRAHV